MAPLPQIQPKRLIQIVEAARGFAAFYVMCAHIIEISSKYIQPSPILTRIPWSLFINVLDHARLMVLLFFLLSGFSISYSCMDRNLMNGASISYYAYSRIRRIYPIFLIALILPIIYIYFGAYVVKLPFYIDVLDNQLTVSNVLASFVFLTDIYPGKLFETLPTNPPIWSLSYEVVYYLLYPLLWFLNRRLGSRFVLWGAVGLSLFLGVFSLMGVHNYLINIFQLYWLWVLGAYLGEMKRYEMKTAIHPSLFYVLLAFGMGLIGLFERQVLLRDWSYGLVFGVIMLYFLNQEDAKLSWQDRFSVGAVILGIAIAFLTCSNILPIEGRAQGRIVRIVSVEILVGIFLFLHRTFNIKRAIGLLLYIFYPIGSISYALYVIHYPIVTLAIQLYPRQPLLMAALAEATILIFVLSYLLERKLQPLIAYAMDRALLPKKIIDKIS